MPLQSKLFSGNVRLERCLTSDAGHVTLNQSGDHVAKIQQFLTTVEKSSLSTDELTAFRYGKSTADAVLCYKTENDIVNRSYESKADNIVGKMTIAAMDKDMCVYENAAPPPQPSSRFARFLPAPAGGGGHLSFGLVSQSRFSPLGPVSGDGFDPDPEADGNKSAPNDTFQMVPTDGARTVFLVDPGVSAGTPVYRLDLRSFSGSSTPVDHILKVNDVLRPGTAARAVTLTGQGSPGGLILEAFNLASGTIDARLQIAVLEKKQFRVAFINRHDSEDHAGVTGMPEQYVDQANKLWKTQANVELVLAGSGTHERDSSDSAPHSIPAP